MGLLKTIAIILLFYYGFKFVARIILPLFAKSLINKAQQNMQNQYKQHHQQQQRPEGEVTINTNSNQKTHHASHQVEAEDVDFEEIKD